MYLGMGKRAPGYAEICLKDDVDSVDSLKGLLGDAWFTKTFSLGDRGKINSFFQNQRQSSYTILLFVFII